MEMGGKVSVDDFRRHPQTPLKQLKVPRDEKKTAAAVHGSGAQIVNIMNNIHRAGESMPSTVIRMVADSYNGSAMQYAYVFTVSTQMCPSVLNTHIDFPFSDHMQYWRHSEWL